MKQKKIISFNGDHGSGKSTIAKKLANKLGYERFYMGKIFRQMAQEHNMSYVDFLELLKNDYSYDKKVDKYVIQLGEEKNNFIIESRTAWYFIPNSFKIYLQVDSEEGARRMFADYQKQVESRKAESSKIKTIEDIKEISKNRKEADDARYKKLYNINPNDMDQYDLVVNTTNLTKEEVFDKVYNAVSKFINRKL